MAAALDSPLPVVVLHCTSKGYDPFSREYWNLFYKVGIYHFTIVITYQCNSCNEPVLCILFGQRAFFFVCFFSPFKTFTPTHIIIPVAQHWRLTTFSFKEVANGVTNSKGTPTQLAFALSRRRNLATLALLERRRLQSSAALHRRWGDTGRKFWALDTAGWLDRCKSSCTDRCLALRH